MIKINLPNDVEYIINMLEQNGKKAYAVGGCVRDNIIGAVPYDWDITTNAKPDEVVEIFNDCTVLKTGIKHGTVTVVKNKNNYEITTFRTDGEYTDNRRPDEVLFVDDIKFDLARRDFTVNAMAYNNTCGLIDEFGGLDDIQNKTIRCVGDANERFCEDSLRILRALRFSSVLGFIIDDNTKMAIYQRYELVKNVSCERIKVEIFKLLCGKNLENIICEYGSIIEKILFDIKTDSINSAMYKYNQSYDSSIVFSAFINQCTKNITEISQKLHLSNYEMQIVKLGTIPYVNTKSEKYVLKLASNMCNDFFENLMKIWNLMGYNTDFYFKVYSKAITDKKCFRLKDLAISGNDISHIAKGRKIGILLNECLNGVIEGNVNNDKNSLLDFAQKIAGNNFK